MQLFYYTEMKRTVSKNVDFYDKKARMANIFFFRFFGDFCLNVCLLIIEQSIVTVEYFYSREVRMTF